MLHEAAWESDGTVVVTCSESIVLTSKQPHTPLAWVPVSTRVALTSTAHSVELGAAMPVCQLRSSAIVLTIMPSLLPLARTLRGEGSTLRVLFIAARGSERRAASQVHCG